MTNESIQKIAITGLTLLLIYVTIFAVQPSVFVLLITLGLVALPDLYSKVYNSDLFLALLGRLFTKQVIAYITWIDENAKGDLGTEMDFTDAPWLPSALRKRYMVLGGAMEMERYLKKVQEKQTRKAKKPTSRGKRG
jgi:hypothetical protein